MKIKKGISLIVLVITIIVIVILAAATIAVIQNGGILNSASEAAFKTEMTGIKEQVDIKIVEYLASKIDMKDKFISVTDEEAQKWDSDLKKEIIYYGQYDLGISEIAKEYAKRHADEIFNTQGILNNLYYLPLEIDNKQDKTYVYDAKAKEVYKIPKTKIGGANVHSINELNNVRGISNEELISMESKMITVESLSHYEPDLSGFALDKTSIVYYDEALENSIIVPAKDYVEGGRKPTIQKDNKTYQFYNYKEGSNIWANILIENSGMESYWVWIPRYAYKITGETTEIIFIDLNNKKLDGSDIPTDYIVHSAFDGGLKGIWVSKYEPVQKTNITVANNPYYLPDLSGFNVENTYIEVYNSKTQSFTETKLKDINNLAEFAKKNNWFNYNEQVWANIKVYEPNSKTESWWVWIPRYAYNITGNNTSIIFIDLNNNPLDGTTLPSNYTVHSAFDGGLKGIWVSKYEPIQK